MVDKGTEGERWSYDDLQTFIFGTDPGKWAQSLCDCLNDQAKTLHGSRRRYAEAKEGLTEVDEEVAAREVRQAALHYLAHVLDRLQTLPIFQERPEILEEFRLVLADIEDLNRGRHAAWLSPPPTKVNPKRLEEETQWVPIISAFEMLLLKGSEMSQNAAGRWLSSKTGRSLSTINRWREKLYLTPEPERFAARDRIKMEINQIKALLLLTPADQRRGLIIQRVEWLLKP